MSTTWIASPCGCTQNPVMGAKRAKICKEHGNLFEKEGTGTRREHKPARPKRLSEPDRDWSLATTK